MELPRTWRRPDPLRGLEDVPWDDLTDHRGCGAGLDELLRCATEPDPLVRSSALDELEKRLFSDGTVCEASAHSVRFLAELGASYRVPADTRDRVIFLMAEMAAADWGLTEDGKRTRRRWNAAGRELPRLAPDWISQTRHAVARSAQKIFEVLAREEVACTVALAIAVPETVPPFAATALHTMTNEYHLDPGDTAARMLRAAAEVADHLVSAYEVCEYTLLGVGHEDEQVLDWLENSPRPQNQPHDVTLAHMGMTFARRAFHGA
ncbi:hypothetical protein [Umezawaea beigongshangensis]|uniref:hypothetical protein n=1 Tax=Umezawaea beigongshangensis TaxID=2780383 RepID=UPI0018F275FB|nr:hypothetical protein [Umezawaea beigongshangensis]